AGVFVRRMGALRDVPLGVNPTGVLTMEVTPEPQWFGKPEWLAMQTDLLARVRQLPGVRVASWATMSPLSGRDRGTGFYVPGYVARSARAEDVHLISVSPEYFDALGLHVVAGRAFTSRDDGRGPKVVVVNE